MKKLIIIILTLFSFSGQSIEYKIMLDSIDSNSIVVEKYEKPVAEKESYYYFTEFDSSKTGSGSYSADKTTVSLYPASTTSKPTLISSFTDYKELRVKFKSSGANYANQIQFRNSDNNKTFLLWYNYNNLLYFYNENSANTATYPVTNTSSNDIMEIRINKETKLVSFYINSALNKSVTFTDTIPENVYITVFEGSYSTTPTTLLSE